MWKIILKYDALKNGCTSSYEPFDNLSNIILYMENHNFRNYRFYQIIITNGKKTFTFYSCEEAKETLNRYIILE
jgi:hypothetical protein